MSSLSDHAANAGAKAMRKYWQRKFPYRTMRYFRKGAERERVERKFERWYVFVTFFTLIMLGAGTYIYGRLLGMVYPSFIHFMVGGKGRLYLLSPASFYLPGFFISLALVILPVEGVQWLLMGKMYPVYNDYYSARQGYDNTLASRQFLFWAVPFAGLISFAALGSFISLDDDSFSVRNFYQPAPRSCPVASVAHIRRVVGRPDRKTGARSCRYEISTAGATTFSTGNWAIGADTVTQFVRDLAQRGIPMDTTFER